MSKYKYNEKDFELLTENTYADGALSTIFTPVKDSLKKYGSVLKDSAKLIGNDIGALISLTFGRLRDLQSQESFMRDYNRSRTNLIDSVTSKSSELLDSWPDGKITSMMVAPGLFFGTQALSGMGTLKSQEFRGAIGDLGFDKVPLLNLVFNSDNDLMSDNKFWNELKRTIDDDDWNSSGEALTKKVENIIGKGTGTNKDEKASLFQKINKIFLWSHHEPTGQLIAEADETDLKAIQDKFMNWLLNELEVQWPIDRSSFLDLRNKEITKIIDGAAKTIELNSKLASVKDHKEFFQILKNMNKLMGDDSKFDVDKVENEFTSMGKKLKEDQNSMDTLKKEFEENKEEPTEEKINAKLVTIVLDQFKGQFLPKLREELTDYYDAVYDIATDKLEKEQLSLISEHKFGGKLVEQIKEHKNKLDEALSKLKRD